MKAAATDKPAKSTALPKPVIRRSRWPIMGLWLIPIGALVAAGFYYHDYLMDHGPLLTVTFGDGSGLNPGQTPLEHRGVPIGLITGLSLSDDHRLVRVQIRLRRDQDAFAHEGAQFWVVRPEISAASISGLSTVVSGPYIETIPGSGPPATEFTGLDSAPANRGAGLELIVFTDRLEHLQADSPIYFRGIQVGVVENIELKPDATGVLVHLFIWRRYASLARSTSHFWLVSGADVKGGILTGIQVKMDSLRSLISGGVAFATQDDKGEPAANGAQFPLYNDADPAWLKWSGPIPVESIQPGEEATQSDHAQGQQPTSLSVKAK